MNLCRVVVAALWLNDAVERIDFTSVKNLTNSLGVLNLFLWFAYWVAMRQLLSARHWESPWHACWVILSIAASLPVSGIVGFGWGNGMIAFALGAYLVWRSDAPTPVNAAGIVLLAISGHELWGPLLFHAFTPLITSIDAGLTGALLAFLRPDITWVDRTFLAPDGQAMTVVGACSAFQAVSTGILAGVAASLATSSGLNRRHLIVLAGIASSLVLINVMRLVLLSWSRESYAFWHGGAGGPVIALFITALVAVEALAGAKWASANVRHHTP